MYVKRIYAIWKNNGQLICTLFGVIFGILLGVILRNFNLEPKTITYINFPGEILMNCLKLITLPLIVASLVSGLSQLDARQSGRISKWAFTYYSITTSCAVLFGILLVLIIHPGNPSIKGKILHEPDQKSNINGVEKFLDVIRNLFPDNLMEATFRQISTEYIRLNESDPGSEVLKIKKSDGMNILGIIVVCIGVGISLSYLGDKGKALADVFISLDHVIIIIVRLLMWYAPIGIASIIAAKITEIKDLTKTFQSLSLFMGTVILGLLLHLFVTISLIYFIASRKNPLKFLKGLVQAAINALGTSSSAASLPITFQCLEQNGISSAYTKFVLPVGAVVNMDGTALYEAVAAIFIAQINGINLSFAQVITVSITATLASIGTAAIPSGGLVTLVIVLSSIGLPVEDISIIFAVDWLLGRLRACVNICGDAVGCAFVQAIIEPNYLPNSYPKDIVLPNVEDAGYFYSTDEIDVSNVCKVIKIAYSNNYEELKQKCKQIMIGNKSELDQEQVKALPKDILFDVYYH